MTLAALTRIAAPLALAFAAVSVHADAPSLYNTGVDGASHVLGLGDIDLHFTVSGGGLVDAPVYVVDDAAGYFGYWMRPSSTSRWITPMLDGLTASGAAAAGDYTYTTVLNLQGFDATQGSVVGGIAADNAIVRILLNGQDIGFTGPGGYGSFSSFTMNAGFLPGLNRLDFVVFNESGPTGVRLEMAANFPALPVPEPAGALLMLAGLCGLVAWRRGPGRAR